jgi:hypothetical protein
MVLRTMNRWEYLTEMGDPFYILLGKKRRLAFVVTWLRKEQLMNV